MANQYLIGVDVGTSGTKAILIDETGALKARCTYEYPLSTPKPLWAEQDPDHWWDAAKRAIRDLLTQSGVNADEVKGVGLSGQMHGSVFLDEAHQVVRPALLWCDQRTQAECDWITETVGREKVVELTSNPVLTGFTAPKIIWLRNHEQQNFERVRKVLLPKDYIRFKLTGEFATEVSDASGTSLFNVTKRDWAWEMIEAIGLPPSLFPKSYESQEVSGRVSEAAAAETGLRPGTPVVGGGGDQAAGAVGNGIVETGVISTAVGTSGVVFAFLDEPKVDPQLRTHTFCHAVPGKWHVMGVMLSAGGSLRWFRDVFCGEECAEAERRGVDPYEVMTERATKAPVGSEGLLFLPYLTGERTPYPDPHARGVFFGATLRHDRAHFARAVLEGVSFGLRDSFEILREMGVPITQIRASGGGARSPLWREILTNVVGAQHVTISVDEGPALGAALLAGVGAQVWPDVPAACRQTIQVASRTDPNPADVERYNAYYRVYRSLYPKLKQSFAEVGALA